MNAYPKNRRNMYQEGGFILIKISSRCHQGSWGVCQKMTQWEGERFKMDQKIDDVIYVHPLVELITVPKRLLMSIQSFCLFLNIKYGYFCPHLNCLLPPSSLAPWKKKVIKKWSKSYIWFVSQQYESMQKMSALSLNWVSHVKQFLWVKNERNLDIEFFKSWSTFEISV